MPKSINLRFGSREELASFALFQSLLVTLLAKNVINESDLPILFTNATNIVSSLRSGLINTDGEKAFEDANEFIAFMNELISNSLQVTRNTPNSQE